jgi:hypothetical protein
MNTFCEHHQNSIKFGYRCFDRILLNGLIQPFQQPERVIGFFSAYREGVRVTRNLLRDIAEQFQNWVKNRCQKWGAPILEAPEGRRDDFVDSYFRQAKADTVVVILKAREPARIMTAISQAERWHLQLAQRWIVQMLRVGRGSVRAGVGASSSALAELRPTAILHRIEADESLSTDRKAPVSFCNSCKQALT